MTKAEILKKEILRQYRSVRQFALEMGIPYSTLVTALERGIDGMAYGTVIRMCDKLSLNPVDFSSLERDASLGAQLLENRVMQYYVKLNQSGRDKILELMDDFVQIDKYKSKSKKDKIDRRYDGMKYDYLIVGAGLFGAVFANEAHKNGKECLVIDRRQVLAGNVYTEEKAGIQVHKYGAHIFHTSNKKVWDYVQQFAEFNHYINSPVAVYKDELYNLPFNMNTFSKMWGIKTPAEARKKKIAAQLADLPIKEPQNLEEQALSLVGPDVYEKLIKGYTEKQWGRDCKDLPAFIIKRLPLRFVYDNNYFTDPYQGIPKGGYTQIVEKLLDGVPVQLGISYREFLKANEEKGAEADAFGKVLYTGMIDEYFDYCLGELQYRSLRFEEEFLPDCDNYQGNAVVNYTERAVPYTRIIEHKHFEFGTQPDTVITKEYPAEWKPGDEPYYPVNDEHNNALYEKYRELAAKEENVLFGGRLGQYRYYDMDKVIDAALQMAASEFDK